ncbi:hypothetical protein ILUMI_01035, partial [Ignelater luminosus]
MKIKRKPLIEKREDTRKRRLEGASYCLFFVEYNCCRYLPSGEIQYKLELTEKRKTLPQRRNNIKQK